MTCGDGDPCTADACNPSGACAHAPVPGCTGCADAAACDDGDPCTEDTCAVGACASASLQCVAGPCELSYCDPFVGECVTVPDPTCL